MNNSGKPTKNRKIQKEWERNCVCRLPIEWKWHTQKKICSVGAPFERLLLAPLGKDSSGKDIQDFVQNKVILNVTV